MGGGVFKANSISDTNIAYVLSYYLLTFFAYTPK